ncbi:WD40-repeat-containing domain protein, partial [Zopfochytrium polystomum]
MFILCPDWVSHIDEKGKRQPIYSIHVQPTPATVDLAASPRPGSPAAAAAAAATAAAAAAGAPDAPPPPAFGRLATGGQDGKIKLWNTLPILDEDAESDATVPKLLSTLVLHTGAVLCVRWSCADGRLLASGSDDNKIVIWSQDRSAAAATPFGETGTVNHETWRAIKVLFGHESDVAHLAWSPDDTLLASCGLDRHVIIWDAVGSFEKIRKLEAHDGFVKGITWDPVGKFLATQSDDKSVKVWRVSDWVVEHDIREPYSSAASTTFFRRLSWSPDGSCIATANGENGNIPVAPIINRDDWSSEVSLVGHQAPIEVASFSPITFEIQLKDDKPESKSTSSVCAIGGQDRGVSVWWTARPYSAASAQNLFSHSVLDLSWSSDGFTLFACSYDGTVAAMMFDRKEFGRPLPSKDRVQKMERYGYKLKKVPVVESDQQLTFEQEGAARRTSTSAASLQPPNTPLPAGLAPPSQFPGLLRSPSQLETRRADGKKRIQPVFIRSLTGEAPSTPPPKAAAPPDRLPPAPFAIPAATGNLDGKKRAGETFPQDVSKKARTELSAPQEFILPTIVAASATPKLLGVPKVPEKLLIVLADELKVEVRNSDLKNGSGKSRVVGLKGQDLQFAISLQSAVVHAKGTATFLAVACVDTSLHVFSLSGRRLLPAIALPSIISTIDARKDFLMVITATCDVRIWNVAERRSTLSDASTLPTLLTDPGARADRTASAAAD